MSKEWNQLALDFILHHLYYHLKACNKAPMNQASTSPWVVLKFGGTSVIGLENWKTIAQTVRERLDEGVRPLVVCSALSGVSDQIEQLLVDATDNKHASTLEAITGKHKSTAKELGVQVEQIDPLLDELVQVADAIAQAREFTPKDRAKALAYGELMSTKLGAEFLAKEGVDVAWHDARTLLLAQNLKDAAPRTHYPHSTCSHEKDDQLISHLSQEANPAIITQGFIARNSKDETVLLGRGGSDVSASYFAGKLGAKHCEIWTDVPGMFTTNPHKVPMARLIKFINYNEAQEIASTGAKVLHPRCIPPLRAHSIPLHIRYIKQPDLVGTIITKDTPKAPAQLKAISSKSGVTLISMETVEMWHQVGFLAETFACFKKHGLSIDLVSTSETNVTVTLDKAINVITNDVIDALIKDLNSFCNTNVIDDCSLVSLVGKNIRAILHQLGPALEVFEEQKIYLVSQASNDLNFTFVVDEDQAERLVTKLHGQLFAHRKNDAALGSTWKEIIEPKKESTLETQPKWWQGKADKLIKIAENDAPIFVYDEESIDNRIADLKSLSTIDRTFYSIKANPYPAVLTKIHDAGFGFECVSIGEVEHIIKLFPNIEKSRIVFTPNFVPRDEYERALKYGVVVTLDNLYPLQEWPEIFRNKSICLRMDPGRGKGHHKYVHTAGTKSKFGIPSTQIDEVATLAKKAQAKVVGLHAHVGSNIVEPDTWSDVATYLAGCAEHFPDVTFLDMGGGLGVVEKPGNDPLDLAEFDKHVAAFKKTYPKFKLWIEPGRFLVADAGVLLTTVTQTKSKGDYYYVGVNAGMNALIRPALYGSYHQIVNISRLSEKKTVVANIVGPICETGDVLGHARTIAEPKEGDVILVATTGAYGKVMSTTYNLRDEINEYFLPVS